MTVKLFGPQKSMTILRKCIVQKHVRVIDNTFETKVYKIHSVCLSLSQEITKHVSFLPHISSAENHVDSLSLK